tara:strand:+ start:130 stop:348 length:219 start_codon:yes stop_codon:yes gene_type:complete
MNEFLNDLAKSLKEDYGTTMTKVEDGDITSLILDSLSYARKMADDARFEALLERIDLATEIIKEHDTHETGT